MFAILSRKYWVYTHNFTGLNCEMSGPRFLNQKQSYPNILNLIAKFAKEQFKILSKQHVGIGKEVSKQQMLENSAFFIRYFQGLPGRGEDTFDAERR